MIQNNPRKQNQVSTRKCIYWYAMYIYAIETKWINMSARTVPTYKFFFFVLYNLSCINFNRH